MSEDCLFCKIVAGEIPCEEVYSDDDIHAFRDIAPAAATHRPIRTAAIRRLVAGAGT